MLVLIISTRSRLFGKRHDYRTRRKRTQALVDAFKPQMEGIADAYIQWDLRQSPEGLAVLVDPPADSMVQGHLPSMVVDIFSKSLLPTQESPQLTIT